MKIPRPEDGPALEMTPASDESGDGLVYPNDRRPRVEKRRLPPRTCALAIVLTTIGTVLLGCALAFYAEDKDGGLELVLLSALTLVPGVYASWHLVGMKLRWPGYDSTAVFNDDLVGIV